VGRDVFRRWLSTTEAAQEIGVSSWWVRERIETGLLPAKVISTGVRRIYRIPIHEWDTFFARYVGAATDPQFDAREDV